MAICLICGTIHNDSDKHECKPEDIPKPNEEFKPQVSKLIKGV